MKGIKSSSHPSSSSKRLNIWKRVGKYILSQEEVSCLKKKFPVIGRNLLSQKQIFVTGRKIWSQDEISCHWTKLPQCIFQQYVKPLGNVGTLNIIYTYDLELLYFVSNVQYFLWCQRCQKSSVSSLIEGFWKSCYIGSENLAKILKILFKPDQ